MSPPSETNKPTPPHSSSPTHVASEKEAGKHVQKPGKPTKAVTEEVERVKEAQTIVDSQLAEAAKVPGAPQPPITEIELELKDVSEGTVRQKLFEEFVKKYPKANVEQSQALTAILNALPTEWRKYKREDKGGPIGLTIVSPTDEPPFYELKFTGMTKLPEDQWPKA